MAKKMKSANDGKRILNKQQVSPAFWEGWFTEIEGMEKELTNMSKFDSIWWNYAFCIMQIGAKISKYLRASWFGSENLFIKKKSWVHFVSNFIYYCVNFTMKEAVASQKYLQNFRKFAFAQKADIANPLWCPVEDLSRACNLNLRNFLQHL